MYEQLETDFREAMAHVSAPVTVITTMVDGVPFGSTVSAFASLSVNPPMVLLALDNRGALIQQVRSAGRIGVSVLSSAQADLAIRFATRGLPDRFAGVDWGIDHGLPRIEGATAWLRCDVVTFEPGGDHTVLLGTVSAAEATGVDGLTYYQRRFGSATAATSAPGMLS
ncbi:flavin reductase family protein [Tessaracoccus antarcticus]|nr:flavin reductase family protein [Tessaracoccus antarcticus]